MQQEIQMGKILRELIKKKGLSQSYLSKKLGIGHSTLHGYLYGTVPRGLLPILKLAELLQISLDELVLGETVKRPEGLEGKYELVIIRKN